VDIMPPTAPKAMRQQKEQQSRQGQDQSVVDQMVRDLEAMKQQTIPGAPKVIMPTNMTMPGNPMMGMPPTMNGMNPMAHMNGNGYPQQMNNGWNGYQQGYPNQMGYNQQGWNNGFQPNMGFGNMPNGMNGFGGGNWNPNQNQGFHNGMGWQGQAQHMGQPAGNFPNQQRTVFSEQPNQQDAYERKPLNPHRSQNKNRKHRPQDFHYV
jgi:protein MPE1